MYLTASQLHGAPNVRHGFFTRNGGVSTGIFAQLNCGGRGTAESAEVVDENRRIVATKLGIEPDRLLSVCQIHGADVVTVEAPWNFESRPQADAMVTRIPGFGLGILTADCAPVLFADTGAGVIGAAHAGWKGACGGVLQATVSAMVRLGAQQENIIAIIGPSIAQPSYEVDAKFHERFIQDAPENEHFFENMMNDGHCNFDLPGYIRHQLSGIGLKSAHSLGNDTYSEESDFFSFRRSTHRGEADYGRQISVITLSE